MVVAEKDITEEEVEGKEVESLMKSEPHFVMGHGSYNGRGWSKEYKLMSTGQQCHQSIALTFHRKNK